MSIHKFNIEALLDAYTSAHNRGAHHASGTILPELVRALVAYVEEVTGTEVADTVDSTKSTLSTDVVPTHNPLTLLDDFVAAQTAEQPAAAEEIAIEAPAAEEIATPAEETASEEPAADETASDAPSEDPALKAPKRSGRKA